MNRGEVVKVMRGAFQTVTPIADHCVQCKCEVCGGNHLCIAIRMFSESFLVCSACLVRVAPQIWALHMGEGDE